MPASGTAPGEPPAPVARAGGGGWLARAVEILAAAAWLSLTADALWLGALLQDWAPGLALLLAVTLLVGCRRHRAAQTTIATSVAGLDGDGAAGADDQTVRRPVARRQPVLPAILLISGLLVLAWPAWQPQDWAPPPADAEAIRVQWQPLPASPSAADETVDVQVFTGTFKVDALPVAAHLRNAARIHHGTWDLPAVSIRSRLPLGEWELDDLPDSKARIHRGSWLAGDVPVRLFIVRQHPGLKPAQWRRQVALVDRLIDELRHPGPVVLYWTGGIVAHGSQWHRLQAVGLQAIPGLDELAWPRQARRHWAVRGLRVAAESDGSAWSLHLQRAVVGREEGTKNTK